MTKEAQGKLRRHRHYDHARSHLHFLAANDSLPPGDSFSTFVLEVPLDQPFPGYEELNTFGVCYVVRWVWRGDGSERRREVVEITPG